MASEPELVIQVDPDEVLDFDERCQKELDVAYWAETMDDHAPNSDKWYDKFEMKARRHEGLALDEAERKNREKELKEELEEEVDRRNPLYHRNFVTESTQFFHWMQNCTDQAQKPEAPSLYPLLPKEPLTTTYVPFVRGGQLLTHQLHNTGDHPLG